MNPNEKMLFGNIFDDKKMIPTYLVPAQISPIHYLSTIYC
jgi:hypothetical protein